MKTTALKAGVQVGEYCIERLIAEGGMGAVYLATHPVIGKRAAVKVMSASLCSMPTAVERFIQEARAVNQVGHRNIVDVFSFGELDDGRAYLVMEYVEGAVLAHMLEDGPLPIADAVAILDQIADAVAAAHESHIVHRDLKPDNVMLVDNGSGREQVKLLDFGIAKLASPEDESFSGRTKTGLVLGTPYYMSPEQARGKGVDHRTDIYALGCVAFEMLTGDVPFPADNPADAVIQHCQSPVPHLREHRPECPELLDELVARMMAKRSDDRLTLSEVRERLATVSGRLGERSPFASTTFERAASSLLTDIDPSLASAVARAASEPAVEASRRRGLHFGLILLALVSAAVGMILVASFADSEPEEASAAAPTEPVVAPRAPAPVAPAPQPKPALGSVVVEVNVPQASVYIDGELKGTADRTLRIDELAPGSHRLEVRASGAESRVQTIELKAGETFRTALELAAVKAPPSRGPKAKGAVRKVVRPAAKVPRPKIREPKSKRGSSSRDVDYTIDPF